jgi:large subunit ribosomal protein L25
MSAKQQIKLAQSLPPRLLRFFERFPPPQLFPNQPPPAAAASIPPVASTTPSENPNASSIETPEIPADAANLSSTAELGYHNPFQPRKNYVTGRWYSPVYGLRKQADLVKLASQHGVLDLLPYTIKNPVEKEKRRLEKGLMVKGTGVGQKVKGKVWERTLKGRLQARREAMLGMESLIQEWKQVSSTRIRSVWVWAYANCGTERTRTWMEEVAEWQGTKVRWTTPYKWLKALEVFRFGYWEAGCLVNIWLYKYLKEHVVWSFDIEAQFCHVAYQNMYQLTRYSSKFQMIPC